MTTVKANQISDAVFILNVSIEKAQTSTDERTAKAIEAMKTIKACAELQGFMNSFANAVVEDFTFEPSDAIQESAMRYVTTRLDSPDYVRQLRFIVEHQNENTL